MRVQIKQGLFARVKVQECKRIKSSGTQGLVSSRGQSQVVITAAIPVLHDMEALLAEETDTNAVAVRIN